eukprot:scaffold385924_cov22-Prasinocladus_malaysianus.AAC.1
MECNSDTVKVATQISTYRPKKGGGKSRLAHRVRQATRRIPRVGTVKEGKGNVRSQSLVATSRGYKRHMHGWTQQEEAH